MTATTPHQKLDSPANALSAKLPPPHLNEDERKRVLMTVSCTDCQDIPKVPLAGQTFADAAGRYQVMHNGIRIVEDCYCGRWMTEIIRLLKGHHEPQEERVFHEILRHIPAGGAMVELGSWWAYYSLWFQSRVADARLFLVEPDPRRLEDGKRNFALNGVRGEFLLGSVGRYSHGPRSFRCEDGQEITVPQYSLDDFLAQQNLQRVELVLADIQGAELDMLEGASKSLASGKIRFLVLSTHHHSISDDPITHQKCLDFLQARQAHVLAAHSVSESFSGDGLIVASMDPRDRNLPPIDISCNRANRGLFREMEYDLAEAWEIIKNDDSKRLPGARPAGRRLPWYRRLLQRV